MSHLFRIAFIGFVIFSAGIASAGYPNEASKQTSESLSYHDIVNYFRLLKDAPPIDSEQYKSVLLWVEKMEAVPVKLTPAEAKQIKASVDQMIAREVTHDNVSDFNDLTSAQSVPSSDRCGC